jgi:hypothetical protein
VPLEDDEEVDVGRAVENVDVDVAFFFVLVVEVVSSAEVEAVVEDWCSRLTILRAMRR